MNRRDWLAALAAMSAVALTGLSATRARASARAVYLATYSHIDAAWLWPLQEGEQQADSVFRSVLDRIDEFPQLRFSESSASYYKWIRDTDPATYARLSAAVASRRWEALGGWWTEADTNVPSGEALMRQGEYGRAETSASFGVRSTVAFLPDSFGSSANLPAILRAQGFDTFVLGRGTFADGTPPPSGRFVWHGLGQAAIVAYNNPVAGGRDDAIATVRSALSQTAAEPLLVWFGLGDHGGGPSRAALLALQAELAKPNPPDVRFSRFDDYFTGKPTPDESRRGELQHVFAGAFANAAAVKRSNFDAQRALVDAERFDVLAALSVDAAVIRTDLADEWRTVLLNQHHDTIAGTAVRASLAAAVDANRAAAVNAAAKSAVNLERIVDRIDHRDPADQMVAVFNPLAHRVRVPVEYAFDAGIDLARSGDDAVVAANVMIDAAGADVPFQLASSEEALPGSLRLIAFAADLPPFGYATFRFRRARRTPSAMRAVEPLTLDNGLLRVAIDSRTGQPSSVIDAVSGERLLPSAVRMVVYADRSNTWGDPGITVARPDELGELRARRVARVEHGRVRDVVRAWTSFGTSRVVQEWTLCEGERMLRTRVRAAWFETRVRLGLSVPHDSTARVATYDVPFGRVQRSLDDAVHPASSFVSIETGRGSVAVLTAGSHALWASTRDLGATLLRSAPYAMMAISQGDLAPEDAQDTGEHEIRAAVAFGVGDAPPALAREADAFGRDFPVRWVGVHSGDAALAAGFMDVDPAASVSSARRVDAGSWAVRLHDESGVAHTSWLTVDGKRWSGPLDAFGIVTLLVGRDAITQTDAL